MHWTRWLAARMRAGRGLLVVVTLLVAVSSAILATSAALATGAATSTALGTLHAGGPAASGLVLQMRSGDDVEAQDRQAREIIDRQFDPATVSVRTTYISEPLDTAAGRTAAWAGDDSSGSPVTLVEGQWPADGIALRADTADSAGITVGDLLDLAGSPVEVVATWRPADPAPGQAGGPGPEESILASVATVARLPGTPYLRWSLTPGDGETTAETLGALARGADGIRDALTSADVTGRGVTVEGSLGETARAAAGDFADATALGVVPLSVTLLVVATALWQVGVAQAAVRDRDTRTMIARGARPAQLWAAALAESIAVAAVGGVAGVAASWGALTLAGVPATADLVRAAAGVAALFVATTTLTAAAHARGLAEDPGRGHRRGRAVGTVAAVLVPVAAVLTSWRLARAGRIVGSAGLFDASSLGSLAVAALLGSAGLVALAVLLPVARAGHAMAGRLTRTAGAWIATAHLARGLSSSAVATLLTVIAVGFATTVALVAGSSAPVARDLAALERGADLRAGLASPVASTERAAELPDIADVGNIEAATPVWIDGGARIGDSPVHLVVAPVELLPSAAALPRNQPVALDDLPLPPPDPGAVVPAGTEALTVELAGRLTLDRWQRAEVALAPELASLLADSPFVPGPREQAERRLTEEALQPFTEPAEVRVDVILRDPDTGLVDRVTGIDLDLRGTVVTWNGDDGITGWSPSSAASTAVVAIPEGTRRVVDAVTVEVDGGGDQVLTLDVTMTADGMPLEVPVAWTADAALREEFAGPYADLVADTPVDVGIVEWPQGDLTTYRVRGNRPQVPPVLAAEEGAAWTLTGDPSLLGDVRLGPLLAFGGPDPLAVHGEDPERPRVPVTLTAAAAGDVGLAPGDTFEIFAFQRPVPAVLAGLTPAVPGSTDPRAAVADSPAIARAMAAQGDTLPWPDELWAATPSPRADAAALVGIDGLSGAEAPADRAVTARATLAPFIGATVGVLGLAVAGATASFAVALLGRRGEVDALHRLGAGGAALARSRAQEHGVVFLAAGAVGVLAAAGMAPLVVPPVVRTATGADASWPIPLVMDPAVWSVALVGWAIAALLSVTGIAVGVRRQTSRGGART